MNLTRLKPVITEKTTREVAASKYTFFVPLELNKIEIAKMIEKKFNVKVKKVNTSLKKGKTRYRGRVAGRTSDKKKAVVTLHDGQTIETLKGIF